MKTFQEFQASRTEMPVRQYGELIGDLMWEDEPDSTRVYVYDSSWYIDINSDGTYHLVLENMSWVTDETTSLEDLERRLYEFILLSNHC